LGHIYALFRKDLLLEVRQQYTFYGILLYVISTIFVLYLSMGQPEGEVWNGLFWMIQLFICINAVAKSFLSESSGRMLYFYSIAGARDFIISKLLFNSLLMLIMSLMSILLFQLLLGNPVRYMARFTGIACLGGWSLSLVFTFLAAVASKAKQQASLMAILGFPLIIPQSLLLMKIANTAFSDAIQAGLGQMLLLLTGMDLLIILLAVILFPFLWKD
jgi:heme exporter protein B